MTDYKLIAPTMDCNMACPYCFESNADNYMSEEVQERTFDFAINFLKMHNCKTFHVIWFGGEPLMSKEIIYKLSRRFIEYCKDIIKISVRVNVDKNNADSIPEFWKSVIDYGWYPDPIVNIAMVDVYSEHCGIASKDCLCSESFSALSNRLFDIISDSNIDIPSNILLPGNRSTYCSAVTYGNFVVDPDRYLYSCWNMIGRKDRRIGDISQYSPMNSEYLRWLLHEPPDSCSDCNLLPPCAGGGPCQNLCPGQMPPGICHAGPSCVFPSIPKR